MEEISVSEPVSPTGQYFNSSVLSVTIIGVLESESPIDDTINVQLINEIFLPINPRFSSIMVEDENGQKHWKRVKVKGEDHMIVPRFPDGLSIKFYDDYFDDYISEIAKDPFPQTRPLWEIHIIKYPTSNSLGSIVFKLHHALGDGYSLMGALLSCLKRADNPSILLTFPNFRKSPKADSGIKSFLSLVPRVLNGVLNTVLDFGFSMLMSTFLEDCQTPIRSGEEGVEFRPVSIKTMTFSLDQIKQIKTNLKVTVNDIVAGVVFLGTRLYMEATSNESGKARSTALVLLNTRSIGGYKSVNEMLHNPKAQNQWGNQFGFLHVPIPKLHQSDQSLNSLKFVYESHNNIKRKRNSWTVYLTGKLLDSIKKYKGPEAAAKYIHTTVKNSSMGLTSQVGPTDKMTLTNHVIKGVYFMVVNVPHVSFPTTNYSPLHLIVIGTYTVTVLSYVNELRITIGTEKHVIDHLKLRRCIEEAYDMIFKAAVGSK